MHFSITDADEICKNATSLLKDDRITIKNIIEALGFSTLSEAKSNSVAFMSICIYMDKKWKKHSPYKLTYWNLAVSISPIKPSKLTTKLENAALKERISISALATLLEVPRNNQFLRILQKARELIKARIMRHNGNDFEICARSLIWNFYTNIINKKLKYFNTVYNLIKNAKPTDVLMCLKEDFDESTNNLEGYRRLIKNIKNNKKYNCTNYSMTVVVEWNCKDFTGKYNTLEEECYFSVHGVRSNNNTRYALEFTPRREFLAYRVTPTSVMLNGDVTCVAACLYEMTFHGFNEKDSINALKELDRRVSDVKKWSKEGTLDQHCKSAEEVFASVRKQIMQH